MRYFISNNSSIVDSELYSITTFDKFVEWLKDKKELALDTETEGLFNHNNRIIMLQVSDGIDSFVVDTRGTDYVNRLKGSLEDKVILGQNLKFDYKFLKKEGVVLRNVYDTFIAECILTNGLTDRKLGLGAISEKYLGKSLDKSVRSQFIDLRGEPYTEKQIVYGAEDVEGLFSIREKQLYLIREWDLENVLNLEFKATLALGDIEYNGLGLDVLKWLKLASNVESKIPLYEEKLNSMVREDPRLSRFVNSHVQGNLFADVEEGYNHDNDVNIKWSSPTQVAKLLIALGIDLNSTSEKEISKYQDQYPILRKFIDYKKDCKLATTYGRNFINFVNKYTNRVHGDFWQILDFRVFIL